MYCVDFFKKWKKEGNFCGLDKGQVSRLNAYMDIVELLVKQKIPEDQIFENFSVGAATPLIAAKDQARTEGLNFVTARLKEGKKIQAGDIQSTLKSCKFTTSLPAAKSVQEKKPEQAKEEKPQKKPGFVGNYQPGELKTTDDPPQPSFAEAARAKEMQQAVVNQPPATAEPAVPEWTSAVCKTGKCPDGQNHTAVEKLRGTCCTVAGIPINQMSRCPIIERRKKEVALGFGTGNDIDPATGGKLIKGAPVKVVPVAVSGEQAGQWLTAIVRGYLTPAQREIWESIRKSGELGDTDLETFEGMIDRMGAA